MPNAGTAPFTPLYRQQEMLAREGVVISRQIMSEWVTRVGLALEPLYNEMIKQVLKRGYLFIDETPIDMLEPGKGMEAKRRLFSSRWCKVAVQPELILENTLKTS